MTAYEFTLKFAIPAAAMRPDEYVERLGSAGCEDGLVGIGLPGRIAVNFTREAPSAHQAVRSALADVRRALPEVALIEAAPDYVGLTDLADILGFSRQNMRKIFLRGAAAWPPPLHEGRPSLWHLASVLEWLRDNRQYAIPESLVELARVTMRLNIGVELRHAGLGDSRDTRPLRA